MNRMKNKQTANLIAYTVVFLTHNSEILFIKFPPAKNYWPGLYNGFGGPIESWENPEESAIRKIYEEAGIRINKLELRMVVNVEDYFERDRLLFFFTGKVSNKRIISKRDLIWCSKNKLDTIDIAPDLQIIIPKLLKTNKVVLGKSKYGKYNELLSIQLNSDKASLKKEPLIKKERFSNIAVSGLPGSGTSTLARALSRKLSWNYISAGEFFRRYQAIYHIPLWDKMNVPKEVDREIDNDLIKLMSHNRHIICDGHYAGYLTRNLKNVYRILLTSDPEATYSRITKRQEISKEDKKEIIKRRKGLVDKFMLLYGEEDYLNPKFFDSILDTTNISAAKAFKIIFSKFTEANNI